MACHPCTVPTPAQGPWLCGSRVTAHEWLCGSTEGLSVTMTIQQGHFPRCHSASQTRCDFNSICIWRLPSFTVFSFKPG